jgi:ATP synthase protein I
MTEPGNSERPNDDATKGSVTSDLASRIARAKGERSQVAAAERVRRGEMTGVGRAFRLASEFAAAIVVGGALGYGADWLFNTQPWGMIIFILLGFAAGVLNVIRATAELNAMTAVPPGTPAVEDDEDEQDR